jgi:hypothetical protein
VPWQTAPYSPLSWFYRCFSIKEIYCTNQHIGTDIIQVPQIQAIALPLKYDQLFSLLLIILILQVNTFRQQWLTEAFTFRKTLPALCFHLQMEPGNKDK